MNTKQSIEQIVQTSAQIIKDKLPSSRVFLFGSRSRGIAQTYSDIDIGILDTNKISSLDFIELQDKLENIKTFYDIQLVDFNKTSPHFRESVLMYAKEIL